MHSFQENKSSPQVPHYFGSAVCSATLTKSANDRFRTNSTWIERSANSDFNDEKTLAKALCIIEQGYRLSW